MDDNQFLAYCETHSETPRRLFSREQVMRLLSIAQDAGLNIPLPQDLLPDWASYDLRTVCQLIRDKQARPKLTLIQGGKYS